MLSIEELDTFKAKLQTKMLEVAIKQAEAELNDEPDCIETYKELYRFLSLYRTAIFELNAYKDFELQKIVIFVTYKGNLSDVVPLSFTGFTNISYNPNGGGVITIPQVIGLQDILTAIQFQIQDISFIYENDILVSLGIHNGIPKTLGQYVNGQTIPSAGKTSEEVTRLLAIEEIPPSYNSPSANLASNLVGYVEKGTEIHPALTPTFYQNDAGAITGYTLKRGVTVLRSDITIPIDLSSYEDSHIIGRETLNYRGTFSYGNGITKNSSPSGDPYPTGKINAGSVTSNPIVVEGILPYFCGVRASKSTPDIYAEGIKVVAPSNGQVVIPTFGDGAGYPWFAIPKNADGSQQKVFTTWQRTVLDAGTIGQPGDLFDSSIDVIVNSDGLAANWSEQYDFYIADSPTAAAVQTTLN